MMEIEWKMVTRNGSVIQWKREIHFYRAAKSKHSWTLEPCRCQIFGIQAAAPVYLAEKLSLLCEEYFWRITDKNHVSEQKRTNSISFPSYSRSSNYMKLIILEFISQLFNVVTKLHPLSVEITNFPNKYQIPFVSTIHENTKVLFAPLYC